MTYRTHIIGGAALAVLVHKYGLHVPEIEMIGYYAGAMVGSLLPDLDHPHSWISHKTVILYYPFQQFGHRKATHSLLAVILLLTLLNFLFGINNITLGIGLGYLSHLILDMLNPLGVPLLYPFIKHKYKIGKIRTGESGEYIVAVLLIIFITYVFLK